MSRPNHATVEAPISIGELIDKITILKLKVDRLSRPDALKNATTELELLIGRLGNIQKSDQIDQLSSRLMLVNSQIWDLEDKIRDCERRKDFSSEFVETARQIYRTNDVRAAIKREINEISGSTIVEEKSYKAY